MFDLGQLLQPTILTEPEPLLWQTISTYESLEESILVPQLRAHARLPADTEMVATMMASRWISILRRDRHSLSLIDSLLQTFPLSSAAGVSLMSMAEALQRIPDARTADAFLLDRMNSSDWWSHRTDAPTWLGQAAVLGLESANRILQLPTTDPQTLPFDLRIQSTRRDLIRKAVMIGLGKMGRHFVLGENLEEALKRSEPAESTGVRFSYDMLGEAAMTWADAEQYRQRYEDAINLLAARVLVGLPTTASISVKLSALHPRYEVAQRQQVMERLTPALVHLATLARRAGLAITVDAEEMDRLQLSLQIFKSVYQHPSLHGWGGLGLAVQAYSKRALPVLVWLSRLALAQGDRIPVRLVKGAYWDNEIKLAQQRGQSTYPVYSRKENTDLSYLVCARFLLSDGAQKTLSPQFATHNASTLAHILAMASGDDQFEFQRLQGMGQPLYQQVKASTMRPVRIYAPVGAHQELLPYLVRRLLENGVNGAFVHQLYDPQRTVAELAAGPFSRQAEQQHSSSGLPAPTGIYPGRQGASGWNVNSEMGWQESQAAMQPYLHAQWQAGPCLNGVWTLKEAENAGAEARFAPAQLSRQIGEVVNASEAQVRQAIENAHHAFTSWSQQPVAERARLLRNIADGLLQHKGELIVLLQQEVGKTLSDAQDEWREAFDYCQYYARQAELLLSESTAPGWQPRGVFIAISPWNFPLAIFLGQIAAALVAGNTVVAKPAEQSPLIAAAVMRIGLAAGLPVGVLQLLPGPGETIGQMLIQDPRIRGVVFTGSLSTAQAIQRTLLLSHPIGQVALIAETGGQNVMIADSTALPEQIVRDVLRSAFTSAGQRCSALRVLCLQKDIAKRTLSLLKGAMETLVVGDPQDFATDIGPVIDRTAKQALVAHLEWLQHHGRFIAETPVAENVAEDGCFVPPSAYEITRFSQIPEEHFGPILHVLSFAVSELPDLLEDIDRSGYGLTLSIHSRNQSFYRYIEQRVRVGNCYINRDQIGAVVESQPFGGRGLSGTGPKAGGPRYLLAFCDRMAKSQLMAASATEIERVEAVRTGEKSAVEECAVEKNAGGETHA